MHIALGLVLLPVLAFNLAAFAAQGIDKRRARRSQWRISESTLLALGLPLGAPGMLLGMKLFRHKISKGSFVARAAGVTIANLLMLAGLGYMAMQGLVVFELALY